MHTRQMETSVPDGPAFERAKQRGNDLAQQMVDKRREEVRICSAAGAKEKQYRLLTPFSYVLSLRTK